MQDTFPTMQRMFPPLKIADIWQFLLGVENKADLDLALDKALVWPADVFCLAAAVLKRSSVYTRMPATDRNWVDDCEKCGSEWRKQIALGREGVPRQVSDLWAQIKKAQNSFITEWTEVRESSDWQEPLLSNFCKLLAIADEACQGFGLPIYNDLIHYQADGFLEPKHFGSTLCKTIHPEKARVLPKTHTPRSGFTLRSLSHHLCYIEAGEGRPLWYTIPGGPQDVSRLNILLVPWPMQIKSDQFRESRRSTGDREREAYFDYAPQDTCGALATRVCRLCHMAEKEARRIDIVILPELAVGASDYRLLRQRLLSRGITLVTGIGGFSQEGLSENRIGLDIPVSERYAVHLRQRKHHPWRLDARQIKQYKLFNQLTSSRVYWEGLQIGDRHLCFVALHPRLLASVLICEDLAQYEPVGQLVRAVGPNLVIALLMDGPQTLARWSHRYAGVLADDPGSSVLALTSFGMSTRSQPRGNHQNRSRAVALWKDIDSVQEFEIDERAHGIVLTLETKKNDEWTADMRQYPAFNPILVGHSLVFDDGTCNDPEWFNEKTEMPEIKFLAPVEASALARLTRLTFPFQQEMQPLERSEALFNLSRNYSDILSRLDPETRRIAYQIVDRSVAARLGVPPPKGMTDQVRSLKRPEEDCQRNAFQKIHMAWGDPVEDDPEVIAAADAILAWRQRMAAEGPPIRNTLVRRRGPS